MWSVGCGLGSDLFGLVRVARKLCGTRTPTYKGAKVDFVNHRFSENADKETYCRASLGMAPAQLRSSPGFGLRNVHAKTEKGQRKGKREA
jgi:hypothetical protein